MRVFLFPAVFFVLSGIAVQCCPAGWTESGGLCLTFHSTSPQNWDTARSTCSTSGGQLAHIGSSQENDVVTAFRQAQAQTGDPVWLGMSAESGDWRWPDGTQLTWTSWANGAQPVADSSTCGTLDSSLAWSTMPCAFPLAFICRYIEPQPSATEPTEPTTVYGNWQKLAENKTYSGTAIIVTLTSPSSIGCVTKCQSTSACSSVVFSRSQHACLLMAGAIGEDELTRGEETEVWVRNLQ